MTPPRPPLLSIHIPTKNRYDTLVPVVDSILELIDDPRIEVVVQDNSPINAAAGPSILASPDARLSYEHRPVSVPVIDNTIRAIERAQGTYLLFIGDDDVVAPDVLRDVERLERSGLTCLSYTNAYYWWNSVEFHHRDRYRHPCALWLPIGADGRVEVLSSEENRRMVLANGAASYYRLPRLYHGLVHRSVLEEIRERTGTYLPGTSPDLTLALSISLVVDEYLYANHPSTVFGASRNSGGGRTVARSHHGRIEDQAHLPAGIAERWSKDLPPYWSEYTVYPQTAMEVLQAFGSGERVNLEASYAALLVNEPWLAPLAWKFLARHCRWSPARWGNWAFFLSRRAAGLARRRLKARSGRQPWHVTDCEGPRQCMLEMRRRAQADDWYDDPG
jgi:hypothetical protein